MTPLAALQIENQNAIVSCALYALLGLAWAITGIVTGLDRGPDAPPLREQLRPRQAGKTLAVGFVAGLVVYTQDGAASFEAIAAASAVAVPIVDRVANFLLAPGQGGSPNRGRGRVVGGSNGSATGKSGDLMESGAWADLLAEQGGITREQVAALEKGTMPDASLGSGSASPSGHATPSGSSARTTASHRIRSAEYATLRAVASQFGDVDGNGSRRRIVNALQQRPSSAVHDAFDRAESGEGGSA